MSELKDRLEAEVDLFGTVKDFAAAMKETGLRGVSRVTVYSYIKGTTSPSFEWVKQAANILGVRAQYLQRGTPPRTEAEAIAMAPPEREPIPGVRGGPSDEERAVQDVLHQVSEWAFHTLFEAGLGGDFGISWTLSRFVAEVYEHTGPIAFGVDSPRRWRGPSSLRESAPSVLVEEKDVRYYVKRTFSMILKPRIVHADPWSRKAAEHALFATLYLTEFDGVR